MYNQQQQNYQSSGMNQQPSSTQSQYRGIQNQYQPAGQVQSYYQGTGSNMTNQNQNQNQNQYQNQYQNQQIGQQFASPEQFHGSNYRGNQAGHDSNLRADSINPSQSQFNMGGQAGYQNAGQQQQQQQQQQQFGGNIPSANQFHTANYQGNQPGHDMSLRADSMNPSQFGIQNQQGNQNWNQLSNQNQFGTQNQNQMGIQNQTPASFHAANYQGNQPGHDMNLRADSTQPSNMQQQFGNR